MPTYFKPLRRKIGVIMLVMACVLAAGWVRSLKRFDQFDRVHCDYSYCITSAVGRIEFDKETPGYGDQVAETSWLTDEIADVSAYDPHFNSDSEWRMDWQGFHVGMARLVGGSRIMTLTCPYWSIVIPLTLMSAWLLLSKPRTNSHAKPTPE